jgi:glycosyltransferase involved in cell wall biosynthesis
MTHRSLVSREPEDRQRDGAAPIRVLLLIKGLGRGGAEQLVVNAVECGDDSRFEYHVAYLLPWKDAFVPELRSLGVHVDCLEGARGVSWVGRLKRLVRERHIDVIHVHSPSVAALVRGAFGRDRPVLVTTEHNVWDRYHRVTYWANLLTYPRNDYVFAVSHEVDESVRFPRGLGFLRRPRVETLHHGIDGHRVARTAPAPGLRRELGIPEDALVIGTVANFKPHKGHDQLLQVAHRVTRDRSDVRIVLVGGGPLQTQLRAEAERLGLADVVVFAGFRDDARRVMTIFDIYVIASLHEGLPLSLLEAMTLGCPVVATRVGGVPAVVRDGENGFIVEPRDPDAQAARIVSLLDDPSLRRRFGEASKVRASGFDVRVAVRRIEEVYTELVA